jgi:hypothetical protein
MITYPHVEDYLEVIAGKKLLPGAAHQITSGHIWIGPMFQPIIKLARYDNGFLDSVTDQTMNGGALTDRQAELAIKLITKYRRQLNAQQIEVPDMTVPQYRRQLRMVDRTKSAGIHNNQIYLKFPYDAKTIDTIRMMAKQSQGHMIFDREGKIWQLALTEFNVNWVYEYATQNEFAIDDKLKELMQHIIACENQGYTICLEEKQQQLSITNAHASMTDYINTHLGGLIIENKTRLIDAASVLGYTVSPALIEQAESTIDSSSLLLMQTREYDFNHSTDIETRVINYAKLTNRYPIVVFNPTPQADEQEWTKHFDPSEVIVVKNKKEVECDANTKLIYTHKPLKNLSNISLLISYVGMMIGTEKQVMVGRAEKIFYTAKKLKS